MDSVKKGRSKVGMSQNELARKCEVDRSYISRLENNKKTPSIKIIRKLSDSIHVCPVQIFIEAINYCDECNLNCPFNIK